MTGKFIVFEGPDRGGKSTQAAILKEHFESLGREVVLTREPGGGPVAEAIRDILLSPANTVTPRAELMLYCAARAQHTQEKIVPALAEGKIVLCERYTMSTCAYQGYGRNLDMNIINELNNIATGGLEPDLTLVFLMSDEKFAERGINLSSDRIELETAAFRERMRNGYKELIKTTPSAELINADRTIEEIKQDVITFVKKHGII